MQEADIPDESFYALLGIQQSATQPQIIKAYRKRSLELHPDKNPGVANIQDRFARLGVVTAILRDPARRERYDVSSDTEEVVWLCGLGGVAIEIDRGPWRATPMTTTSRLHALVHCAHAQC
jgi:DnaJ-class molecular chaperone